MSVKNSASIPKWIVIGTAIAGLITAVLTIAVRYYEMQKTRAEVVAAESAHKPAETSAASLQKGPAPSVASATDQERIQGRWEVTSTNGDAKMLNGPVPTETSWTFRGNQMSGQRKVQGSEERSEGTFSLRGAGGEGLFDFNGTNWRSKQMKYLGIYRLVENQLTLCFHPLTEDDRSNRRADSFVAGPDSGRILLTLRRATGP